MEAYFGSNNSAAGPSVSLLPNTDPAVFYTPTLESPSQTPVGRSSTGGGSPLAPCTIKESPPRKTTTGSSMTSRATGTVVWFRNFLRFILIYGFEVF